MGALTAEYLNIELLGLGMFLLELPEDLQRLVVTRDRGVRSLLRSSARLFRDAYPVQTWFRYAKLIFKELSRFGHISVQIDTEVRPTFFISDDVSIDVVCEEVSKVFGKGKKVAWFANMEQDLWPIYYEDNPPEEFKEPWNSMFVRLQCDGDPDRTVRDAVLGDDLGFYANACARGKSPLYSDATRFAGPMHLVSLNASAVFPSVAMYVAMQNGNLYNQTFWFVPPEKFKTMK